MDWHNWMSLWTAADGVEQTHSLNYNYEDE